MDSPPLPPALPPPFPGFAGAAWTPELALAHQAFKDAEHLRLLALFHYIVGGVTALFASIFIIHIVVGLTIFANSDFWQSQPGQSPAHEPPPAFIGYIFAGFGTVIVLLGWTVGGLTIFSGRCIKRRQKRLLSLIMAGVNCMQVPFGTTLGVFTLIVLLRPSVEMLYCGGSGVPSPAGSATSGGGGGVTTV